MTSEIKPFYSIQGLEVKMNAWTGLLYHPGLPAMAIVKIGDHRPFLAFAGSDSNNFGFLD